MPVSCTSSPCRLIEDGAEVVGDDDALQRRDQHALARQQLKILPRLQLDSVEVLVAALQWIKDQRLAAMRRHLPLARNEEGEAETQINRVPLQLELVQRRIERERAARDARLQVLARQDAHLFIPPST
jgi:hypothetical protein